MASVEERIGRNEAIFRQVNESIALLSEGSELPSLGIVCECAEIGCREQIAISVDDYQRARSDSDQFIVAPGHVVSSAEDVVFEGDGFVIVRKKGEAAEAADEAAR